MEQENTLMVVNCFSGISNAFPYFIVNSEMCTLNS
jgi:hypothetical protein